MSSQSHAQDPIRAIQSMLASGHTSVHLERHTFMLWGLAAAGLILFVPTLFSREHFPDGSSRILWQNLFISAVLLGVGIVDYRWTARHRARRDLTVSFIQRQITQLWWMLVALIVVINIGMNIYGGGYLFYSIALVLIGIGLYVHGLFSRQLLCWGGGLMMAVGLALLAVSPPIHIQEWVAASAFGIGLPALSLMVGEGLRSRSRELALSLLWLTLVLAPVALALSLEHRQLETADAQIELREFLAGKANGESGVVILPAGTPVPLTVHINGDALLPVGPVEIPLQLHQPVAISLNQGVLGERVRVGDGPWLAGWDYHIRDWRVTGRMAPGVSPELTLSLRLDMEER